MSALTDVFRYAEKTYLASLPTKAERRRFLDTAGKVLTYDDAFKALPTRTRAALLTRPIETDAQEKQAVALVLLVAQRIATQAKDPPDEASRRRARLALLILQGLSPNIHKNELIVVERDLLKLYNATTAAEVSKQNKSNRGKPADNARDLRLRKRVAEITSTIKNKNLSKNGRAKYVLQRLHPQERIGPRGQKWTASALIKWARARGLTCLNKVRP